MMLGTMRPLLSAFNGPSPSGKGRLWGKPALDTLARSCRSSFRRARITLGRLWLPGQRTRSLARSSVKGVLVEYGPDVTGPSLT